MGEVVRRHYCFRRKSLLNDPLNDIKWLQEQGFPVIKRQLDPNAKIDSDGCFIGEPSWIDEEIYITYKQIIIKDNQEEFGYVNFDGKDYFQFITIPQYNVKINDLIIVPSEYDMYSETPEASIYKVKKVLANTFNYQYPRTVTITVQKRQKSELFDVSFYE